MHTPIAFQIFFYGFQMRQFGGRGNGLGFWDGNAIKLGCDDYCTTINVINSLSNIKNTAIKKEDIQLVKNT